MLRTRLTLRPGRPGTRRLADEYGNRLLCVRYRYDDEHRVRYKTVELIVEESPWTPTRPFAPTDIVELRIRAQERALRHAAHLLGARRIGTSDTWRTTYAVARILQITTRVMRAGDDALSIAST